MAHPVLDALMALPPEERSAYKHTVYGAWPTPDALTAGNRIVSIIEGPTYENGVVKVVLALLIDSGLGFELIDLGDANPFYFANPPILVPDAGGDVVRTHIDGATGLPVDVYYREDLDQALMQACMDAVEHFQGTGGEV